MSSVITQLDPRLASVLAPGAELERIATGFKFTEGPLWDPASGALLFSDIPANRICSLDGRGEVNVVREPSGKSNGLTWDPSGCLVACEHAGRRVSITDHEGAVQTLVDRYERRRLNSPNDLVFRSDGTLYFSDPPYGLSSPMGEEAAQEQPISGLYLLRSGESECRLAAGGWDRPNGLAFSPDESYLYVADTPRYLIRRFRVEADGSLTDPEDFASFKGEEGAGRPDGMKVTEEGVLFVTGPGGLWILSPEGDRLGRIRMPEKAANCAWGERDGSTLYIAASTSIYRIATRTRGILPPRAG